MRILVEDLAGVQCAHQVRVDLDDGKGLRPLGVIL